MSNVQNFAEIGPNLPFTEYNFYEFYRETFEKSELRRMKRLLPGKWDTDIVREEGQAVQRAQRERLCKTGTCKSQGNSDGELVLNAERALRPEAGQGQDKDHANTVLLLRHPHGECGTACGQNKATSEAGSGLKDENIHMQVRFQRGTTPLPTRMDEKSDRNDRNEI